MRKMPALAILIVIALGVGITAPLVIKAQNNGTAGGAVMTRDLPAPQSFAGGEDMPHRTAREFAPLIRAMVTRRFNAVKPIFKIRRSVETSLEQPEAVRVLARFQNKPDRFDLNLIGGRTLGNNIGILYFTIATEEGPVAFKVYYYGFSDSIYIARMDIMDDWSEIETTSATMDSLPSPITVSLSGQVEGGG